MNALNLAPLLEHAPSVSPTVQLLTRDAAAGPLGAGVLPLIIAPNPADLPVAGR
jgi:hypothetical protein